jgi:hypothetical protein
MQTKALSMNTLNSMDAVIAQTGSPMFRAKEQWADWDSKDRIAGRNQCLAANAPWTGVYSLSGIPWAAVVQFSGGDWKEVRKFADRSVDLRRHIPWRAEFRVACRHSTFGKSEARCRTDCRICGFRLAAIKAGQLYDTSRHRIYHLQAELADGKITDRVQGILLENSTPFDLGSVMRQHVDRVLDGTNGSELLVQQVAKLEAEVQTRRVIAGAKQILQKALHLSEEEAYLRLRNTSRRSRRPLIEIAGEVVGASRSRAATAHP